MTDKELLELASKACGLEEAKLRIEFNQWNPLTDDADALRLAVTLRLDIGFEKLHTVSVWSDPQDGWIIEHCDDGMGADISEKTRRAITRAAAEIGRSMK